LKSLKDLTFSILDAFRARNQKQLRKLNDSVMEEAALNFSKTIYELAVLSYILSKIVSKPRFLSKERAGFVRRIEDNVRDLAQSVGNVDEGAILAKFRKIDDSITILEKEDQRFVRGLVSKGKLKTAATMYAQGISLGLASEMTGISQQDILGYAGRTMMFDRIKEEMPVKERLKAVRKALGGHE
jgi:hypothetical protein